MTDALPLADLYAFGDSLSDDGKTYGTFPLAPLFGGTAFPVSPPYADGRYSNGPMWTEYLADSLGAPSALDRNFALGGATAGVVDDPADPRQTLGNFAGQIDLFEAAFGAFAPGDLVTVTFGGNDVPLVARQAARTGTDPEDGLAAVADTIGAGLDRLAGLGAERIVVTALPDLALVPFVDADPDGIAGSFGATPAELTGLTRSFNALLAEEVAAVEGRTGADVTLFDTFAFFEGIVADPAAFGIENLREEVLLTGSTALEPVFNPAIDGRDPAVADATLFFDQDFHPTTAVHARLADAVEAQLLAEGLVAPADSGGPDPLEALVTLLFQAFLGRAPGTPGLAFWAGVIAAGTRPAEVADAFAVSPELAGQFGDLPDGVFVELLYDRALDRAPDPEGRVFWTGELARGALDRGDLGLAFATSGEAQARLGLTLDADAFDLA